MAREHTQVNVTISNDAAFILGLVCVIMTLAAFWFAAPTKQQIKDCQEAMGWNEARCRYELGAR